MSRVNREGPPDTYSLKNQSLWMIYKFVHCQLYHLVTLLVQEIQFSQWTVDTTNCQLVFNNINKIKRSTCNITMVPRANLMRHQQVDNYWYLCLSCLEKDMARIGYNFYSVPGNIVFKFQKDRWGRT